MLKSSISIDDLQSGDESGDGFCPDDFDSTAESPRDAPRVASSSGSEKDEKHRTEFSLSTQQDKQITFENMSSLFTSLLSVEEMEENEDNDDISAMYEDWLILKLSCPVSNFAGHGMSSFGTNGSSGIRTRRDSIKALSSLHTRMEKYRFVTPYAYTYIFEVTPSLIYKLQGVKVVKLTPLKSILLLRYLVPSRSINN